MKKFLHYHFFGCIIISMFCFCHLSTGWADEVIHQVSHKSNSQPSKPLPNHEDYLAEHEKIPSLIKSSRFKGPIYFCGENVPIGKPHVMEALEKEMLLILWNRPQVILWIKRAARYFPHIEPILVKEGLPQDIKYVPIIESSLRPHARSSAGATGFWQFMKSTGRKYGLTINSHIDERRNIFDSTRAACAYIKDLKDRFHSYPAALAAYNMGENGLARQVQVQETSDYYSLYLNQETSRYVYRMIAVKMIMENPEAYGFQIDQKDLYPPLEFSYINIKSRSRTPIMLVAKGAQVSFRTIKDLNPHIRGYHFGPGKTKFLVPKGKEKNFKKRFSTIYKKWERTSPIPRNTHIVKSGETLTGIAKKYRMSTRKLLRLNHMSIKATIHPGDRIKIE